jgi:hypothetical protein
MSETPPATSGTVIVAAPQRRLTGSVSGADRYASAMAGNPEPPFPFDVTKQFSAEPDRVHRYLERYFREDAPASERFTGRWFETLIGTSDPDRFTATDLVAVSTLSVTIPPEAVALILLDRETAAEINELLHRSPKAGTDLATVHPEDLAAGAPLHALYTKLRDMPEMGPTKTSKLLAAKRPDLVPIRDQVVSDLLGAGELWWAPFRQLARDWTLRDLIHDASNGVVPPTVSFLRQLDVVLWMWGRDEARRPTHDLPGTPHASTSSFRGRGAVLGGFVRTSREHSASRVLCFAPSPLCLENTRPAWRPATRSRK